VALRERASLNSLIQVGGRVNRHGEYGQRAEVWDFRLKHEGLLKDHPAFLVSGQVLGGLFAEGKVGSGYATLAMQREIRMKNTGTAGEDAIVRAERIGDYPKVTELFKVIDTDTVTVVVDRTLVKRLEQGESIDRNLLQQLSVQIWSARKELWQVKEVPGYPGLYYWPYGYDDFLGYMAGVLKKALTE
jgi:CRISPR-associated endonuclease/helicase Cas3